MVSPDWEQLFTERIEGKINIDNIKDVDDLVRELEKIDTPQRYKGAQQTLISNADKMFDNSSTLQEEVENNISEDIQEAATIGRLDTIKREIDSSRIKSQRQAILERDRRAKLLRLKGDEASARNRELLTEIQLSDTISELEDIREIVEEDSSITDKQRDALIRGIEGKIELIRQNESE